MLKRIVYIAAISAVLLSGCSTDKTMEMVDSKAVSGAFKPKLDLKVETAGNTATVYITTDLKISKDHYGMESMKGEGHIHLYIDNGEKITITDYKYVTDDLSPGKHTLKVSLHNNDHTPYDVTKELTFEIK